MVAERRISSTFKDVPGGQVLGPTFDYTHRLLDFTLMANGERPAAPTAPVDAAQALPRVGDILEREGMLEPPPARPTHRAQDITRTPLTFPADAAGAAAEPGARRRGLPAGARLFDPARLRQQPSVRRRDPLRRGAGVVRARRAGLCDRDRRDRRHRVRHGQPVRRLATTCRRNSPAATASPSAMPSARRWRWRWSTARCAPRSCRRHATSPAQDEEFVLAHSDSVEASGFVQHLKLPHYVDFQSELVVVRTCAPRSRRGAAGHARQAAE